MSFSFLFNLLSLFTFVRRRVEFWEPIVGSGLFLFLGRVWLTELVDTNCNSNDYAYVYLECLAFFCSDAISFRLAFVHSARENELAAVFRYCEYDLPLSYLCLEWMTSLWSFLTYLHLRMKKAPLIAR